MDKTINGWTKEITGYYPVEYQKVNPIIKQIIKSLNVKVLNTRDAVRDLNERIPTFASGCYFPEKDFIVLNEFDISNKYSSDNVILHELIHWTGLLHRLNRTVIVNTQMRLESNTHECKYEEQIAIEGSILMHNCLNLDPTNALLSKTSYSNGFLAFVSEASWHQARIDAQKAVNFIFKKLYQIDTKY